MTRSVKSPWQKFLDRRTDNIGFISRLGAFKDPTPEEKAKALAIETKSWQDTKGQHLGGHWKISTPYSSPLGHGFNLKATREAEEPIKGLIRELAIDAYMKTPMDATGVLKEIGIDVRQYEKPLNIFQKFYKWVKNKIIGPVKTRLSYFELQQYFKEKK